MLYVQDPVREENQFLQQQLKEKDELIVRLQAELVRKLNEFNVTFHNSKFHNHLSIAETGSFAPLSLGDPNFMHLFDSWS